MNGELVGGIPTALKNMSSSVRIMKFPIYGKIKNVPNHQPVFLHVRIRPSLVVEHNISTSSILQLELVMLQYVEMIILFLFTL